MTKLIEDKRIEIAPLAFMRGRTLSNAFVVLDEAQNATSMQMKMFLTRLGEGSRMVITGDRSQVDLPRGVTSGLADAERLLKGVGADVRIVMTPAATEFITPLTLLALSVHPDAGARIGQIVVAVEGITIRRAAEEEGRLA